MAGLAQVLHGAPSRAHWNVAVATLEWNVNVTEGVATKPEGPLSITVFGGFDVVVDVAVDVDVVGVDVVVVVFEDIELDVVVLAPVLVVL